MEPRPPTRRDAPTIAVPPAVEPNGHGGAGDFSPPATYQPPSDYQPTGAFDPYTAPESEAQMPYGPTAGYPGDSATRLGPLADEPVFYPNPSLPPNRPAYDPVARYDARSEYALHPVGRVPPDHTPLNLRPAPPPVPPQIAPPERNNLIKGILAGVIGLIAVVALVAAVLAFANGGFGDDDDSPPPATVPVVAGQPGDGAAGVASPSAAVSPSEGAAAGAPVLPGASSVAPSAADDAEPSADEAASDGAAAGDAPTSDEGNGSAEPSADAGANASASPRASRSASGDPSTAGSDEIAAFLPPPDDLPAGFDTPSDEGDRSLTEVAGTFVLEGEDASQAEADLDGWGWVANEYVAYDAIPQPANEDINRYAVSVHEFETEDGASEALPAFVDAFGVEPTELPADTAIGDEIVALQTTNDDGNLVVLYVRSGVFLLKIDAASVSGDPLPAALDLAEQLLGS